MRVAPDAAGNSIGNRAGILSWAEAVGTIVKDTRLSTWGYPGDLMIETGQLS